MKVLITGCAGFIGSNLLDRLLNDGYDVTGIDCFNDYYPKNIKISNIESALHNKRFTFINKDIIDLEVYPDADYVFHMAAEPGVRSSWGNEFKRYLKNNIEVTQKLLEYYNNKNIKKFVYSSSSSVYGDNTIPMTEDLKAMPISPYGASKLAAENLCYAYWKNYNMPTTSLRYFTVYGPRLRPDMGIYKFVNAIVNNKEITVYGDGSQLRDFTFVEDVLNANILAANSPANGEVFNIGGGNIIAVIDLINKLENIIGKKALIKYTNKQSGDVEKTWADVSKAKKILKWTPETGIDIGLKIFVKWFLDKNRP